MCKDFAPNFGDKTTGCCNHHNAPSHSLFFTREFLTKNNMTVVPTHPTFLFPQLKIKLKGTIEVIEAESQAVLNTLSEHASRMHLKMAEALGTVHTLGRVLLRG
jgi:hypothetical protein